MSQLQSPFKDLQFRGKSRKYFTVDLGTPRFNEIDSYQVLWNGHYVTYFEEARMAMLRHFNVSLSQIADRGYYFPIYKMSFQMRKPILEKHSLVGAIRMEIVDGVIIRFKQMLRVDNETHALATVDHMLMDAKTMKAILNPPADLRSLFEPMVEYFVDKSNSTSQQKPKLRLEL